MEIINNKSYMLFIKIWNNNSECFTDYGNIESIVKEKLLEFKWSDSVGIDLCLKKIQLSPIDKGLGLSDITVNTRCHSYDDDLVLETLNNIIKNVDEELRIIQKLNINDIIIFKLLKTI